MNAVEHATSDVERLERKRDELRSVRSGQLQAGNLREAASTVDTIDALNTQIAEARARLNPADTPSRRDREVAKERVEALLNRARAPLSKRLVRRAVDVADEAFFLFTDARKEQAEKLARYTEARGLALDMGLDFPTEEPAGLRASALDVGRSLVALFGAATVLRGGVTPGGAVRRQLGGTDHLVELGHEVVPVTQADLEAVSNAMGPAAR